MSAPVLKRELDAYSRAADIFLRRAASRQADPIRYLGTKPISFNKELPDPTRAQLRSINQPSGVELERGLIGTVIQGRGAR